MRAAVFLGPHRIEVADRLDPKVMASTDAVVRVTLGCVCGSDLWYYRGVNPHALGPIGHEFIGVGTCANCVDGGQGEYVRAPFADATLVKVPGSGHSDAVMKSLVALSDVMCTGHHAASSAGVKPGDTVAVVGDGAVGLCAVIAARRLGAERIIALSRNPVRQALAREFGATDIVTERGDDATKLVMDMTGGVGVDAALECVGTGQSMNTAFGIARVGSIVGAVGVPHDSTVPLQT